MATAASMSNSIINLNQGGTAQIGQLSYEKPYPVPKYFNAINSEIFNYNLGYTDGDFNYTLPAGCGAWEQGTILPSIVNLTRYIAAAGNYSELVSGTTIWQTCENGQQTYEGNGGDWSAFKTACQNKISWIWGSFTDGGCGIIRVNSTQVKFIGTYGIWNNQAGDDERIACTEYGPYTYADFVNSGVFAVYYRVQTDSWSDTINIVCPNASQVVMYQNPSEAFLPLPTINYLQHYGSMYDTLNNRMSDFGDGSVNAYLINLTTVASPYTNNKPIYQPGHEITVSGYLQTWGSDETGIGENEYTRGSDGGSNKGNGDYDPTSDKVDPTDDSQFTVDAQSCGFVTVYTPDKATLQSFAAWLYGTVPTTYGSFLDNIKKLQLNPMDGIISLNLSHYSAATSGSEPLDFYGQPSSLSAPVVSKLTQVEDCGSISINETISGWMSYNDQTKIKVFLPYCGMYSLSTNEVTGGSLNLKYIIDVLSGACVAEITVKRNRSPYIKEDTLDAPIYRFTGNIFQQIPISAVDYSGIIQGQLGLAAGMASLATGNIMGGLTGITNQMMTHPNVERVGSYGASYGYMGSQEPFVMIEYPCYNMPNSYEKYYGEPIYDYRVIGDCKGLIYVDKDTFWGTDPDRADFIDMTSEEEELLKQAVSEGLYMPRTTEDFKRKYYDPNS